MKKLAIAVELTNLCNFSCQVCPHSKRQLHTRKTGIIEEKMFEHAIVQCQKYAKSVILGFFGEQLLHPQYIDFIKYLKNRKFKLVVNTNVSLCTKEIMNAWMFANIDEVRFSLDAIHSKTFNLCRPGPVLDFNGKQVAKEDRLATINDKIKYWLSIPKHRPTRLVYVKSSFNKNDKIDFIKYWKPKIKKQDHILLKQVISYGGKISNPFVLKHSCNIWDIGYLMIGWNGITSPCNLDINLDLNLGSILKNTIPELYLGKKAQAFKKVTGCGKRIIPCKTCTDSNNWSKNEVIRGN